MNSNAIENETGAIWVIADHFENRISDVTFQLIGQARKLADGQNQSVGCLILGHELGESDVSLCKAGADIVYRGDSPRVTFYQQDLHVSTIVTLAKEKQPSIILLGSTSVGRELAPLVAAGLKTGLSAHCIDLIMDEKGILEQKIPAYGGLMTITCPNKRPQMATCAEGVFPTPAMDVDRAGTVVDIEINGPEALNVKTLEIVKEPVKGVPLEQASSIVAGGAGAGDKKGWDLIRSFAESLHAALGCTRPAVDEGWAELDTMIGQSGKMVNPDLYIGVGLSGELQHMVGIMDARLMIAINNDRKSPVFEQVDYGVVDDCREFLTLLIERINESRKS